MTTTDLGLVPGPKPGPTTPNRVPTRGAGVSDGLIEMRSRVIAMILTHSKDAIQSKDDLLEIAEWIVLGPDDEEDET